MISVWAIRTVTNTDQYVATMAPLARNPVIVDHLATKTTDELFSSHVVQNKIADALPKAAKTIVTPIVSELHNYVYGLALKFFESPKFGQLWDMLNRHTHDRGRRCPHRQADGGHAEVREGRRDRRQPHP